MIYHNINELDKKRRIITVGNFDGFHLAHKTVLQKLIGVHKSCGFEPLVITFYPHPRRFFGDYNFKLLQTLSERLWDIIKNGVDNILVLHFKDISNLDINAFIEKILIKKLNMVHFVVGSGHSLGKGGVIIDNRIEDLSDKFGFTFDLVKEIDFHGRRVSSSYIRELMNNGNVREANLMLTKPYTISGPVIKGKGIGKKEIGKPTINIGVADYKLIPIGVYAGWTLMDGKRYPSVINCGPSPTIDIMDMNVETHIIGWEGEAPRRVSVELVEKIREQVRFKSIESLREQIDEDIRRAIVIL